MVLVRLIQVVQAITQSFAEQVKTATTNLDTKIKDGNGAYSPPGQSYTLAKNADGTCTLTQAQTVQVCLQPSR